ncbi:MAG TPA: aryl-sulfate sulfotransferase [Iamia sp.]|nr:aryl-sulfate sulfotransferase [Iamia sp.]
MPTIRTRRRGRRLGLGLVVALVATTFTSCDPLLNAVVTVPGMYPAFQSTVTDYVNRCNPSRPTEVKISAPPGAAVSVAGRRGRGGKYTERINQRYNERFLIVVTYEGKTTSHYVRCLPPGFPTWKVHGTGEAPQSEFYVTTLINAQFRPNWPVIFDSNGVPVWWSVPGDPFLTTPLPNGNLATMRISGGMVEQRLDGSTVRVLDTEGAPSDFHDVLLLPNGNYAMVTAEQRQCDLSAWGQPPATCIDHEVQELTPAGEVVWRWAVDEHIPITETPPRWRSTPDPTFGAVDPWHFNSIEWTGDGFLLSFRHLDAVYKVDYATRTIDWKLGGTRRPESLRVIGDRFFDRGSSISGQHDARLQPDGTITIYDNRSNSSAGRQPRMARYRIDEGADTATLVHEVREFVAPESFCCGSTRVLPTGNYVTGWGGTPWFTENKPDGTAVFRLEGSFVYRAIPLAPGEMSRDAIRAGMDAQFDGAALAGGARRTRPPEVTSSGALGDPGDRLGVDVQPLPG